MNDRELQCFVAVADNLSFTRAAQELYLSVSTVTHHVHVLEKELGTELFYRTNKTVSLTRDGRIFYHSARLILDEENQAKINIESEKGMDILRIGCTSTSETYRMVPFLKELFALHTDIIPEIHMDAYTSLIRMLLSGMLHFCFGCSAMGIDTDLIYVPLRQMRFFAILNRSNPLGDQEEVLFHLESREIRAVPVSDFHEFSYGVWYKNFIDNSLKNLVLKCCRKI